MGLIDLSNKIIDAFKNNCYAFGVFSDLSKGFDTINHNIMLSKLYYYGIRGVANDWFTSYLDSRIQCTNYRSSLSEFKKITCGVPRGSLLGPLLFTLYTRGVCIHIVINNELCFPMVSGFSPAFVFFHLFIFSFTDTF